MFEAHKSTGTTYTITVAFLAVALIFIPAVLAVSRPIGLASVALGFATSVCSLILARIFWKRSSQLAIPSIAGGPSK